MDQWTVDEAKLIFFANSLATVFNSSLLSIENSGIAIYDTFNINETHVTNEKKNRVPNKSLLQRGKSELELLLYESKRKLMPDEHRSPSEGILQGLLTRQNKSLTYKKKKISHQAWNNRQLIKVYGMRYAKSVRNLSSLTKSQRKNRINSMTPTKVIK